MTEKIPSVLSDEELHEIWMTGENVDPFEDFARVAQAQRDADVAYYEKKIGEIFEEIEKHKVEGAHFPCASDCVSNTTVFRERKWYQSLKAKHLKG